MVRMLMRPKYAVEGKKLVVTLKDGSTSTLDKEAQFVGFQWRRICSNRNRTFKQRPTRCD